MTSSLRKVAQAVRHAPILRSATPVWRVLRRPYLQVLKSLASDSGISVRVGGVDMRLHPEFATQNWETVEGAAYRAFADLLRPGDVVYDVGAHIGTYTLIALKTIGPAGRIVAYEPHALTRRYLEEHLRWNGGMDRTVIRSVCCGASSGTADFYCLPDRAEGMSGLVPVQAFSSVEAPITTIDEEVRVLAAVPTVIKIDVEGAEWDVLKGAEQTLRNFRPRISLSLHPPALASLGVEPAAVLRWLLERGYATRIISEDHEIHVVAESK